MSDTAPSLSEWIGHSAPALDTLMPMHLWIDETGNIRQAGPTICKMARVDTLAGRDLFEVVDIRRPIAARHIADLLPYAGHRLALALHAAPHLQLRGTLTPLPDQAGSILDVSLGLSFAKAVREFDLTLTDFSPCDQTVELMYLHEANASTAQLSRILSERLEAARAAAEAQALTDALTGLANRRAMDQELGRALADPMDDFALLHIDLDLFKQVNDTFGHAAGDRVLERVGEVLRAETRSWDVAARVGGDEFLVMARGPLDEAALAAMATRLIAAFEVPIPFEGHHCQISASVGIASVTDYENRPSIDEMLADTDIALYHAKRGGRGRHCLHTAIDAQAMAGRRATDPHSAVTAAPVALDAALAPDVDHLPPKTPAG